eukprot:44472-Chlamydomonas_euryale.AAC.1
MVYAFAGLPARLVLPCKHLATAAISCKTGRNSIRFRQSRSKHSPEEGTDTTSACPPQISADVEAAQGSSTPPYNLQ